MASVSGVPVEGHGGCSCCDVSTIDPPPGAACVFNGLAKLLSVGSIDRIDRRAERGSAKSRESLLSRADPRDVDTTGNKNEKYISNSFLKLFLQILSTV